MKKYSLAFVVLCVATLAACGKREASETTQEYTFDVVKSPFTGKCYEAVSYPKSSTDYVFEISCEFYKQKKIS